MGERPVGPAVAASSRELLLMRGILARYLLRETLQTWLVVTVVLLLILVIYQLADVLSDAASAKMPRDAVLQVLGLTTLPLLAVLTPIALFLSILIALGRFYRDSEMAALMACGIGPAGLYRPLSLLAVVLAMVVGWLSLAVNPAVNRDIQRIAEETRQRADLGMLQSGRFMTFGDTQAVVYAETVKPDGELENVFVQRSRGAEVELIVARRAWQGKSRADGTRILHFGEGRRYEGRPGSAQFKIVSFKEHGIPIAMPARGPLNLKPDARPLMSLIGSDDPDNQAELQWRVSMPLTVLVLTLLAVPLSRASPRQGRYTGLISGILAFIVYANLLIAARSWVERQDIPAALGLWWVHLGFIAVALIMLASQHGYPRRWFAAKAVPA